MSQIRVALLGGFTATGPEGRPLALPTRKAEAILALLVCRAGEPQPRERVTALLWGDRGDRQARHSLSQTLTSIRGTIGDGHEPFLAERESIAIEPAVVSADVIEFTALAACDDLERLRKAAELYRGALLDGFRLAEAAFDEWLSQERSRFQDLAVSVLTRLAEREAAAGEAEAAVASLERAVALDPLSEESHRNLMRVHLARGNYNAVIRHYRDCCDLLKRELGTVPEPATTGLYQDARASLQGTARPARELRPTGAAARPPRETQEIRFCMTGDGVRIAFAGAGGGPPVVKTANWLNHLEFDWQSPVWRHLLRELSAEFRLIRYDERGNGLSDWKVDDFSLDALVRDLESVVDAAGLDRFPLLGISQGCAIAIGYAVRHPERVTRMLLHGGYAKGYIHALTHWRRLLGDLNTLRTQRGMCVILLAHARVEKFEDPESSAYDRYSPRLHKHVTALLTEWADAVLFATRRIITKTEEGGFGRERTIAAGLGKDGGERVLRTVGSPACVAKNRYGLPAELPLSWPALMQALAAGLPADAAQTTPMSASGTVPARGNETTTTKKD